MPKEKSKLKICCCLTCMSCVHICCFPNYVTSEQTNESFPYRPFRSVMCENTYTIIASILCCFTLPFLYCRNEFVAKKKGVEISGGNSVPKASDDVTEYIR